MRSSIDPLDDRIGRAFQFVMQSALDQAAEHGICRFLAVQGKAGDIRLAANNAHRPMHGLDDIATNREVTQLVLDTRLQRPAAGCNLIGKTEAFQSGCPADHQAAKAQVFA